MLLFHIERAREEQLTAMDKDAVGSFSKYNVKCENFVAKEYHCKSVLSVCVTRAKRRDSCVFWERLGLYIPWVR